MLVVAATERELALLDGLDTFCCGIGPVEAALQTARALEERKPEAVVHVGIAGSRTLEPPVARPRQRGGLLRRDRPGVDAAARRARPARCRAARAGARRSARGARAPDRDLRQGRRGNGLRRRGDGGLRRAPRLRARRRARPSSCARSPTRRTRPTGRAGGSTTRSPRSPTRYSDSTSSRNSALPWRVGAP